MSIDYSGFAFPKPPRKEKKKNYTINKRSKKQNKLERERDKNLNKSGKCEYCNRYFKKLDPHEIYGGSNRIRSIKNRFVALLCRECHDNEEVTKELRIMTQLEYEKTHTREEFIQLIGKSYVK